MERIWLSAYAKGVPNSVHFDDISLNNAFRRTVSRFGDRSALMFQERVITYRELDRMVSRFAAALVKLGVKPGDKVSLILPNLVQTVVGFTVRWRWER